MSADRKLTEKERELIEWLAHNPTTEVSIPIHELDALLVSSQCECGCASIDFALDAEPVNQHSGISVVSDYLYRSTGDNQMGCFLFMADGHIAGLEVWSVDGVETPAVLPLPDELYSYDDERR